MDPDVPIHCIALWPTRGAGGVLANVWDRNFAAFCHQRYQRVDRTLEHHLTGMLRTYIKAEEQAWVVKGAVYELLNAYDAPRFRGIINSRFDPWAFRS